MVIFLFGGESIARTWANQDHPILPYIRSRNCRTSSSCCRCPRKHRKPTTKGTKLPHTAKAGAFRCDYQYRPTKTQGIDLLRSLNPAFYCLQCYQCCNCKLLKYFSQHFLLICFRPLSHSCKDRMGMPIFFAKGFLPKPKDSRYARIRLACPS